MNIPDKIVPLYDPNLKCKHNNGFKQAEECLVRISKDVCLINDVGERILPTEVFARPSDGPCQCLQRFDGHRYLLWNLGGGRVVDYSVLLGYLHKWRGSGISMYALFKSILDCAQSCGVSCSLKYYEVHKSICGFFTNLEFDIKKAFSCPTHGTSPPWLVADGKALGPLKKRVKHLTELDVAKEDNSVLTQSTHYKDRVFLSTKKERNLVVRLLTGDICMETFSTSNDITTENGIMIMDLVRYIREKFPEEIPNPYVRFLKNISKNSSARSLVQVNGIEVLEHLSQFCRQELDLRVLSNQDKLKGISEALPAVWPILENICSIEKSKFLPVLVSRIVLRILKIRFETQSEATVRSNSSYFAWSDPAGEHPTMCYPLLPLWRHPSKYRVSDQTDADICEKSFAYHSDFVAGFYSVGCGCEKNITFGFELMLLKESPRNLFRFLMCRDVDLISLKGILVDHACIFEVRPLISVLTYLGHIVNKVTSTSTVLN